MRRFPSLAALALAPLLCANAGAPDPAYPIEPPGLSSHHAGPKLRPDLAFAGDFVRTLMAHGIQPKLVEHSTYNGFFEDTRQAAHIATKDGVLEVVVFPYDVATKVKVVRRYDAEGGVYLYEVTRTAGPDGTTTLDSPCATAVMMVGRWFILTDSEKLARVLHDGLHPTLAVDGPSL